MALAQSRTGRIHVLFTSDIYGRFAWPGCGERGSGHANMTHMIAAVQAKRKVIRQAGDEDPIVLSGGSLIRPDILGQHIFGPGKALAPTAIKLIERVGFDAVTVGPYDFGAHPDALKRYLTLMSRAKIPLLAGNVTCEKADDFRCRSLGGEGGRRYLVLQRGDVRVGITSVTRQDMPERILGRSRGSLTASDPVQEAKKLISTLRKQERADVVILLATLNLESDAPQPVISLVRSLGDDAPDLVVADAMFHRDSPDFIARVQSKVGATIVGTDRFGQHLGHAVVHYSRTSKEASVPLIEVRVEPVAQVTEDPASIPLVQALMHDLCQAVDRTLGEAHVRQAMDAAGFRDYLMEIMRNTERAEVSILNDSSLADTRFAKGPMTREKVLRVIRSETHLGSVWLTGARLTELLSPYLSGQKSGLRSIGLTKEDDEWLVNGRPLLSGLHYRVAMTRFVADGGDGLLTLGTERFRDSGHSLREVALSFFEQSRQARIDGDPSIDPKRDFPDPWEQWVLYAGSELGFLVSDLSVNNGPGKDGYNQPLLQRDSVTALKLDANLSIGASNKDHALETDVKLQYGQTWTTLRSEQVLPNGQTITVEDTQAAETLDLIRVDILYRLNSLKNLHRPGRWYMPMPYAEARLITEFSEDNTYTDDAGVERTYRYLDLGGTIGAGLMPHPLLFIKAGFTGAGEILTPDKLPEKQPRAGVYLGYKLRRLKLWASTRYPLQLESRLDWYLYLFPGGKADKIIPRNELTLESKLYVSLVPTLFLTASHNLYVYAPWEDEVGVANDISFGLELILDYRHQHY